MQREDSGRRVLQFSVSVQRKRAKLVRRWQEMVWNYLQL